MHDHDSLKRKSSSKGKISITSKTKRKKERSHSKHHNKKKKCRDVSPSQHVDPLLMTEYDSSNSESDLDIEKPLFSIVQYIGDPHALAHQLFRTIRGRKLQNMLPDILHRYSLEEIRDFCGRELEVMSKKRISRILGGSKSEDISSSSSEEENEMNTSEIIEKEIKPADGEKLQIETDTQLKEIPDSTCIVENFVKPDSAATVTECAFDTTLNSEFTTVQENECSRVIEEDSVAVTKEECNSTQNVNTNHVDRKKLEILELELRARAIRAMLKSQLNTESDLPK